MPRDIHSPFTENFVFSGPSVAISCEAGWDHEQECYVATNSSTGFKATSVLSEIDAALACFQAWMTGRHAWKEVDSDVTA